MRQLTESELKALSEARQEYEPTYVGYTIEELAGFDAGYTAACNDVAALISASQSPEGTAERDALQRAVAAWKKSAKRHRQNEIRKQNHLEYAVKEVDRLEARCDALAAFVNGEINRAKLDYILSNEGATLP